MTEDGEHQGGELKRFRAVVHGRVQGVYFRHATLVKARGTGVVGYVRNLWDGTVEVVAEGKAGALQELVSWLRAGPNLAYVSRVKVTWQAPRGRFRGFEVRY